MAWLFQSESPQSVLAARFRELIQGPKILKLPGAHDALAALMAKQAGFQALYLSGAAYTASRGLPDLGVVSAPEVAERARELVRATDLPLLVDIDTGFGGVIQAALTARLMAEARVAAARNLLRASARTTLACSTKHSSVPASPTQASDVADAESVKHPPAPVAARRTKRRPGFSGG